MRILIASSKPDVFNIDKAIEIVNGYGHELIAYSCGKIEWYFVPKYDFGISAYYLHKVPDSQLRNEAGDYRWINIHPSLTQVSRGRNLCHLAIMNGDKEFGVTAHEMISEYDAGDIIEQVRFPIEDRMNAGDLAKAAGKHANELLLTVLERLCRDEKLESNPPEILGPYTRYSQIDEFITLYEDQQRMVRAICTDKYPAKTMIGGRTYIIKPEDSNV